MCALVLSGDPPIEVVLRRSARARRITLRVSSLDGRVTMTLPNGVSDREAARFATEKESWLRKHLAKHEEDIQVRYGVQIPVLGESLNVIEGDGRRIKIGVEGLSVPGPDTRVGSRLSGFLKTMARARLAEASDNYAESLGCAYSSISIRDTRSRWGSCSSSGRLMYSWRLVLAPPDVLHYVAAHEVAHLKEMNHSSAFWDVVETLYGDYAPPRRWLRENGALLHRFKFESK
ncbi:MAG: SprT family zinc-dependent metalloprotease [Paracoccaceae bacterium]